MVSYFLLVASTLNMEKVRSFKTLTNFYRTTRRYIPYLQNTGFKKLRNRVQGYELGWSRSRWCLSNRLSSCERDNEYFGSVKGGEISCPVLSSINFQWLCCLGLPENLPIPDISVHVQDFYLDSAHKLCTWREIILNSGATGSRQLHTATQHSGEK
jgi:hypothetical protein